MVSQVIDYIEEGVLINRGTYEKMSKEHLAKQIRVRNTKNGY